MADAAPLDPWAALVRPNVPRLAWHLAMYIVWSSLFLWGLETAAGLPGMQLGLWATALGCVLIAGPCVPLSLLGWYVLIKPRWLRDPALRARIEREGMYAAWPWWQHMLYSEAIALSFTVVGHEAWLWVLDTMGWWGTATAEFYRLPNSLTIGAFGAAVMFGVDIIRVRQLSAARRAETMQRQLAEAQLQRLQAQLEPHMLFNTLANLHALIDTQPARAQDMLAHLIDYLRATLGATRGGHYTLASELRLVGDYLALMQIRMGERLKVDLDIPEDLRHQPWPPMLLQPLVENAVLHGLDPLPEGGLLTVQARLLPATPEAAARLQVDVIDNGQGLPPGPLPEHSFGLSCVRDRLATSHGSAGVLAIGPRSPRGTLARLTLPVA
ncbi:MAG: hypothetical protein RI907_2573 [Pseudomonadota bacterium]|jgi:signal transduction histidine kinase